MTSSFFRKENVYETLLSASKKGASSDETDSHSHDDGDVSDTLIVTGGLESDAHSRDIIEYSDDVSNLDDSDVSDYDSTGEGDGRTLIMTEEDGEEVGRTLLRIENDVALLKAKCRVNAFLRKPKSDAWLKPWLTNNLLLLTFLWQVLNVLVLHITGAYNLNDDEGQELTVDIGLGIMVVFQSLHLLLIIVVSVKLVKQVVHHTVSGWFLIQSYLSSILLFAGIYTLLYRVERHSFRGVLEVDGASSSSQTLDLVLIFIKMLYFSVTVMCTVCSFSPLLFRSLCACATH
jgi:hypothetical protein